MTIEWSKITELLKLKAPALLGVFIAASVLLFVPPAFLDKLGLTSIVASYRSWLGVAWLLSGALLVAELLLPIFKLGKEKLEHLWRLHRWQHQLHDLSPQEKEILRGYLQWDTKTRMFQLSDGSVGALEAQMILFRSSRLAQGPTMYFDYNIQPWAWTYLRKHPALIDWDGKVLSEAEKKQLLDGESKRKRNSWMAV